MPETERTVLRAQETTWSGRAIVWELFDEQDQLIGWTLDVPPRSITQRDCYSYRTGAVVPVRFTPLTQYIRMQ